MKQIVDPKTLETALDTLDRARDGIGDAWRELGKVKFRKPWIYRKSIWDRIGSRPWFSGILMFSSVLAAVAAFLYLRKRKQVTDRYNMGETEEIELHTEARGLEGSPLSAPREESLRSP